MNQNPCLNLSPIQPNPGYAALCPTCKYYMIFFKQGFPCKKVQSVNTIILYQPQIEQQKLGGATCSDYEPVV